MIMIIPSIKVVHIYNDAEPKRSKVRRIQGNRKVRSCPQHATFLVIRQKSASILMLYRETENISNSMYGKM